MKVLVFIRKSRHDHILTSRWLKRYWQPLSSKQMNGRPKSVGEISWNPELNAMLAPVTVSKENKNFFPSIFSSQTFHPFITFL